MANNANAEPADWAEQAKHAKEMLDWGVSSNGAKNWDSGLGPLHD